MQVKIKLSETRRDVWCFVWEGNRWRLGSYLQQSRPDALSQKWTPIAAWCPGWKNWDGVTQIDKPINLPGVVENELREQARKAPIEL